MTSRSDPDREPDEPHTIAEAREAVDARDVVHGTDAVHALIQPARLGAG